MLDLPPEIIFNILNYLCLKDSNNFALASKHSLAIQRSKIVSKLQHRHTLYILLEFSHFNAYHPVTASIIKDNGPELLQSQGIFLSLRMRLIEYLYGDKEIPLPEDVFLTLNFKSIHKEQTATMCRLFLRQHQSPEDSIIRLRYINKFINNQYFHQCKDRIEALTNIINILSKNEQLLVYKSLLSIIENNIIGYRKIIYPVTLKYAKQQDYTTILTDKLNIIDKIPERMKKKYTALHEFVAQFNWLWLKKMKHFNPYAYKLHVEMIADNLSDDNFYSALHNPEFLKLDELSEFMDIAPKAIQLYCLRHIDKVADYFANKVQALGVKLDDETFDNYSDCYECLHYDESQEHRDKKLFYDTMHYQVKNEIIRVSKSSAYGFENDLDILDIITNFMETQSLDNISIIKLLLLQAIYLGPNKTTFALRRLRENLNTEEILDAYLYIEKAFVNKHYSYKFYFEMLSWLCIQIDSPVITLHTILTIIENIQDYSGATVPDAIWNIAIKSFTDILNQATFTNEIDNKITYELYKLKSCMYSIGYRTLALEFYTSRKIVPNKYNYRYIFPVIDACIKNSWYSSKATLVVEYFSLIIADCSPKNAQYIINKSKSLIENLYIHNNEKYYAIILHHALLNYPEYNQQNTVELLQSIYSHSNSGKILLSNIGLIIKKIPAKVFTGCEDSMPKIQIAALITNNSKPQIIDKLISHYPYNIRGAAKLVDLFNININNILADIQDDYTLNLAIAKIIQISSWGYEGNMISFPYNFIRPYLARLNQDNLSNILDNFLNYKSSYLFSVSAYSKLRYDYLVVIKDIIKYLDVESTMSIIAKLQESIGHCRYGNLDNISLVNVFILLLNKAYDGDYKLGLSKYTQYLDGNIKINDYKNLSELLDTINQHFNTYSGNNYDKSCIFFLQNLVSQLWYKLDDDYMSLQENKILSFGFKALCAKLHPEVDEISEELKDKLCL